MKSYAAINTVMLDTYWNIGRRIVEQEQQGKSRADYGAQLLSLLANELTTAYGTGFSTRTCGIIGNSILCYPIGKK